MPSPDLASVAAFAMVALASSSIANAGRRLLGLPLISGYIAAGAGAGPCVLGLLTRSQCVNLASIIGNVAMGFIGFNAGTKILVRQSFRVRLSCHSCLTHPTPSLPHRSRSCKARFGRCCCCCSA